MTSKRALAIAAVVAAVTLAGVWVVSYLRESPPSSVETTEAGPTVAADGEVAAAAEEKTPEPDVTEAEAEEMLADVLKAREVSAADRKTIEKQWRRVQRNLHRGDREKNEIALTEARKAVEMDPRIARSHVLLSMALDWLGRLEESVAALEKARSLDSLDIRIRRELGRQYSRADRLEEAIIEYEMARDLAPDYAGSNFSLHKL